MANKFATWLKDTRERYGVSGNVLAQKVGVHQTSISKYETGDRLPSRKMVLRIAEALNVNPEPAINALMGDTPGMPEQEIEKNSDPDALMISAAGLRHLSDKDRSAVLVTVEATAKAMIREYVARQRDEGAPFMEEDEILVDDARPFLRRYGELKSGDH